MYELETLHVHRAKLIVDSQRKDEKSDAFAAAVDSLSRCETQLAKVNIEFNKYRALNHVHLGSYVSMRYTLFWLLVIETVQNYMTISRTINRKLPSKTKKWKLSQHAKLLTTADWVSWWSTKNIVRMSMNFALVHRHSTMQCVALHYYYHRYVFFCSLLYVLTGMAKGQRMCSKTNWKQGKRKCMYQISFLIYCVSYKLKARTPPPFFDMIYTILVSSSF